MEVPRWEILKKPFWATQTWPWASFSFFALFDLKTKKFRNLPSRLGRFQQIFLAFLSCDKISPKSGHEWEKETFFISTKKTILDRKECMAQKIFPLPDGPILFIYFFELNWRQTNKQTNIQSYFAKQTFDALQLQLPAYYSVTRLGNILNFGQLFKACGNNYFAQVPTF